MVWHAAVYVVLDARFLGGISKRAPDSHFVAPMRGVDKGQVGVPEEIRYQLLVRQRTLDDGDIGQVGDLVGHDSHPVAHLRAHLPSYRRGDTNEACGLTPIAVDSDHRLACHAEAGASRAAGAEESRWMLNGAVPRAMGNVEFAPASLRLR